MRGQAHRLEGENNDDMMTFETETHRFIYTQAISKNSGTKSKLQ